MNFIEKFLENCKNNSEFVAVVDNDGNRRTTYNELLIESKKIAKKLISLGVKYDDNIIICLPKCMEYIASIFGIIFAGAVYIPLSENYPIDRRKEIMDETKAKIIIDNDFIKDIDTFDMIENINVRLNQNICIVYTSGSNGMPKGVLFDFEAMDITLKRLKIIGENFTHNSQLYICPFYFSAHVLVLIQLIFDKPGTIHLIIENKSRDLTYIIGYLDKYKIEYLFALPSVAKSLENAKYLKTILIGGEKVNNLYSDRIKFICLYAQTEGVVFSHIITEKSKDSVIGRPEYGIIAKILDDYGNEVKNGVLGEICGIGKFAKCYYKDYELTKKTFVRLSDGNILLHTNDMGYIDKNGDIVYVTRKNDMIKVSGKRIEPSEIENVIKSIEGVSECIVKNVKSNNKLCAFYTTTNKKIISANSIIEKIHKKLPLYMIPDEFIYKEEMPINGSGKIDKLSLEVESYKKTDGNIEPAKTKLEKIIIEAFKKVLGDDLNIGRNDDFFYLGGSSLLAMVLSSILYNYGIGFQDIYKNRTPEMIAKFCNKYDEKELKKENELELKNDQSIANYKKMTILGYLYNSNKQNCTVVPMVVEMKKSMFELEKLAKSAYEVFKSHPAIGSIIVKDDIEKFKLRYKPEIIEPIEILDLKDNDIEQYTMNLMDMGSIIDKPNYRCKIVRTERADYFIFIQLHTSTDEYSLNLLFRQIIENYTLGKIPEIDYYYLYLKRISNMKFSSENKKLISEINSNFNNTDYDENLKYDTDITEKSGKTISYKFDTKQSISVMNLYTKNMKISFATIYIATLLKTIAEYNGTKKVKCQFLYNSRDKKFKNNIYGGFLKSIIALADFDNINSNEELFKAIEKQNYNNYLHSDLISLCDRPLKAAYLDFVNLSIGDENPIYSNIKVRFDILTNILSCDLFPTFCYVVEPSDKNENVVVMLYANMDYYKESSFNKFVEIYKKNFYDILQL